MDSRRVARLLAPRPVVAGCLVFAALGAIGFIPLFGGPGYEQSLASGLLVPSATAIETALAVSRSTYGQRTPLACVARGLASGLGLAAVAYATALLHGARVGLCDLRSGSLFFALTALSGALLAGVWGAVVGEACRGRRFRVVGCVLLGAAAPLFGMAVSVVRFYASPIIFAYDPFFGYFSGTLYDTVIDVRPELWTYRAGSACTLGAAVLASAALDRSPSGAPSPASVLRSPRRAACLAAGLVFGAMSVGSGLAAPALGHTQTASTIAHALGGHAAGPHCTVFYPDSLLPDDAELLVRDCEEELAEVEARLGGGLTERVTVFVFADADQKRRLMGAAETSIAKPWRREVYVQLAPYPHPVLGHELAHVVAGEFARGPFRVGGGLLPNPGLIEGIAVAASPDDDALTGAEWARAMLDLGLLPPLRRIFSLGFLGESASKSYTVAGAFVEWALDRFGKAAVRAWYGGASIEQLSGLSWDALEREFTRWLRGLAMPDGAASYARARFERPSVWSRRCPHQVDALERAADQCRDARRIDAAGSLYTEALRRDPNDHRAPFELARIALRYGDHDAGRTELLRIATDASWPRPTRDRAEELLADDDLALGRDDAAGAAYRTIAGRTLDEDAARTLEIKALGAASPAVKKIVLALLVGDPMRPVDPWVGALAIGEGETGVAASLAFYLAGRNLAVRGNWPRARAALDAAWALGSPTPLVGRELLRLRAVTACVLGERSVLDRIEGIVRNAQRGPHELEDGAAPIDPSTPPADGRLSGLRRLIARCAR